jgi:hypothetical protein
MAHPAPTASPVVQAAQAEQALLRPAQQAAQSMQEALSAITLPMD